MGRSAPGSGATVASLLVPPAHWTVAATAALLLVSAAGAAEVLRIEELRETYGSRFCEVAYKTSAACQTRLVLFDAGHECALRPPEVRPDLEHRVLVPLAPGREVSYSIVFPDGSRSAPRRLMAAAKERAAIAVRQEPAAGGGLDILASGTADATWTLELVRSGRTRTIDGGRERSRSARFHIEKLGVDDAIESATIRAKMLDGIAEASAGPILGDRRLASAFADAAARVDVDALLDAASETGAQRDTLDRVWRDRASRSGLAPIVDAAASRALDVVSRPSMLPPTEAVAFCAALMRLGSVDALGGLRGWGPVIGAERSAQALFSTSSGREPPARSHSLFEQDIKHPLATLAPWPGVFAGGPDKISYERLQDPRELEKLVEHISRNLSKMAQVIAFFGQMQLCLWQEWTIRPEWLGPPDSPVTLWLDVGAMEPECMLLLRLNDRVLLPFRLTREAKKASRALTPTDVSFRYHWLACTTSSRFFKPGKNSWVLTAQNTVPRRAAPLCFLVREIRLSAGRIGFDGSK